MTQEASPYYICCINHAMAVLRKTPNQVIEQYADCPISTVDYCLDEANQQLVEKRIEPEAITMTCIFDQHGKCTSAYFFTDNDILIKLLVNPVQTLISSPPSAHLGDAILNCSLQLKLSSRCNYRDQYLLFYTR